MTGNKVLLDTNIVVEIFAGNKEVADKIAKLPRLNISSIAVGELFVGINRVNNKAKHLKQLRGFLQLCTILDTDSSTAEHYGAIVASLYKKGKPIPTNDIWIAAIALQYDLTIVTRDKHFNEIAELKIKIW